MSSLCKSCGQLISNMNYYLHTSSCIPVFQNCPKCNCEILKSELEDHLFAHSLHDEEQKQQNPSNLFAPSQPNINEIGIKQVNNLTSLQKLNSNNNIQPFNFAHSQLKISENKNLEINKQINKNVKNNMQIDDSGSNSINFFANNGLNQKRSELFKEVISPQSVRFNDKSNLMFNPFRELDLSDDNPFKINLFSNICSDQSKKDLNKEFTKNFPNKINDIEEPFFNKIKYNQSNKKSNSIFNDPESFKDAIITTYEPKRQSDIFKVEKVSQIKSLFEENSSESGKKINHSSSQVNSFQHNLANKEVKHSKNHLNKFKNKKNFYSTEDHVYTKIDPKLIPLIPESSINNIKSLNETECSICLDDFKINDKILTIPCSHYFHSKCIKTWLLEKDNTCPSCKFILDKNTIH